MQVLRLSRSVALLSIASVSLGLLLAHLLRFLMLACRVCFCGSASGLRWASRLVVGLFSTRTLILVFACVPSFDRAAFIER